jgi:hypothetical protein
MTPEAVLHSFCAVVRIYKPYVVLSRSWRLEAGFLSAITPSWAGFEQELTDQALSLNISGTMALWTTRTLWASALCAKDCRCSMSSVQSNL